MYEYFIGMLALYQMLKSKLSKVGQPPWQFCRCGVFLQGHSIYGTRGGFAPAGSKAEFRVSNGTRHRLYYRKTAEQWVIESSGKVAACKSRQTGQAIYDFTMLVSVYDAADGKLCAGHNGDAECCVTITIGTASETLGLCSLPVCHSANTLDMVSTYAVPYVPHTGPFIDTCTLFWKG